jgi:hypothetical protein
MHDRKLEFDRATLPLGLPGMQRPYPLIQTDLVHGQQHFQPHHQSNLRPGCLQRNRSCILQCHKERSQWLCLWCQYGMQRILPKCSYSPHSFQIKSRSGRTTYTESYRAAKVTQSSTTSRRTAHPRPPSQPSVHQLLCPRPPTGQSGTAPKAQKTPPTRLPLLQAPSASTC